MKAVRYFQHPTFPEAQWASRNPYLKKGEIGFVLEGVNVVAMKVGPGYWNDLSYTSDTIYRVSDPVLNQIGDAVGNLSGKTHSEIFELMLNPYQVPVISGVTNNAAGAAINESIVEIGLTIPGPVSVNYNVSNQTNLQGATPIQVSAGAIFNNEGNFANSGSIQLNLTSPLNPSVITTYTIQLRANHVNGLSNPVTTKIKALPKLIWGVSPNPNLDAVGIMGMAQLRTLISESYKKNYDFNAPGYPYVAIPSMMAPSNMFFADVSNPEAPANYSFEDRGALLINNGVGTYMYQIFRGTYYININSVLKIA